MGDGGKLGQQEDQRIGLVLLGRYRIVRKMGEGGMGDVYEGIHELISKRVAIKCMHAEFAKHPEAVERFKREARAATSVGHDHIVDVNDLGELPDGSPFLVMEFLEGQDFSSVIANENPLSVSRVAAIAIQTLEALHAAHAKGIVHRDMKPENIFIIERGGEPDFAKVLDFGISLIREKSDGISARMTQTGVAMGTPHYMSPEQARGAKDVDHRTDIYSCGVILYEALSGDTPFDAESFAVLMSEILTAAPDSVREVRPDVPVALDRLILRAMAKDPDLRPQSALEFANILREYVSLEATPVLQSKVRQPGSARAEPFRLDAPPANATVVLGEESSKPGMHTQAAIDKIRHTNRAAWPVVIAALAVIAAIAIPLLRKSAPSKEAAAAAILKKPTPQVTQTLQREVDVVISASPSSAQIFIGDTRFPNPLTVKMPKASEPVDIKIVKEGYQTRHEVAVFDRDHKQHFELVKIQQPPPTPTDAPVVKQITSTSRKKRPKKTPAATKSDGTKKDEKIYRGNRSGFRDTF